MTDAVWSVRRGGMRTLLALHQQIDFVFASMRGRVLQFHRRLYTLDSQIHHLQQASIRRLGAWLARRWAHCQEMRREAEAMLLKCEQPRSLLEAEYKKQVAAQTKPLPKRTKNAGKLAVEEVVRRRKALIVLKERVKSLEEVILDVMSDNVDVEVAAGDLAEAKAKLAKSQASLKLKEAALGVNDRQILKNLTNSPYIQARMNARALKCRLREKLRSRKFELDRVERNYHRKKTDTKLKTHIEDAVKRRDPGIQELVRHYNKLCAEMERLIKNHKAPRNALPPEPIAPKSVWGLDVDDEIWQDIGLDDAYDEQEPPLWLKSEAVRDGIKAMLQLDRCLEEEPRLFHECRALRYWLSEEWDAVALAKDVAREDEGNAGLEHQLALRQQELCQLCATWESAMCPIPFKKEGLPAWGPSDAELLAVRIEDVVAKTGTRGEEEDDEVDSDDDDDDLPIDEIEAFQRAEVYAEGRTGRDDWGTLTDDDEDWFAT
ncbi:hypothetical protein DFH06DRAFT_1145826 [Mycena polygramma]|nr:hypothetical protein DFH06DRAFT_1145826 [Mycena polygramma]